MSKTFVPEIAEVRLAKPRARVEMESFISKVVLKFDRTVELDLRPSWIAVVLKEVGTDCLFELMMLSTHCDHGCLYTHLLRLPYTASFLTFVIATVVHGNDGQKTREIHGFVDDVLRLATTGSAGDCVQAVLDGQKSR